jgi:metacaspase-1
MPAKGVCLAIGLNQIDLTTPAYTGMQAPVLQGCENDANSIAAAIQVLPEFVNPATVLLTASATKAAVTAQIQQAVSSLVAGDLFVLHYSGHGMQGEIDSTGAPTTNVNDASSWVLYDAPLSDDELADLLSAAVEGTRIVVISDSCFSGLGIQTNNRMARGLTRAQARQVLRNVPRYFQERRIRRAAGPATSLGALMLFAACAADEEALDDQDPTNPSNSHGLYTATLLSVFQGNGTPFSDTYEAFQATIASAVSQAAAPSQQNPPDPVLTVRGNPPDAAAFTQSSPPFQV